MNAGGGVVLIVDGYNVIFRLVPAAHSEPQEVRRLKALLEDRLRAFGRQRGLHPWLVYDGQRLPGGVASGTAGPELTVSHVEPPAEADDFIVQVAVQEARRGMTVKVVTSDLRLAQRLRHQALTVQSVEDAEQEMLSQLPAAQNAAGRGRLQTAGGLQDVETHFLGLAGASDSQSLLRPGRPAAARPGKTAVGGLAPGATGPAAAVPESSRAPVPGDVGLDDSESRQRRRERGRLRQERRLRGGAVGKRRRRR